MAEPDGPDEFFEFFSGWGEGVVDSSSTLSCTRLWIGVTVPN